MKTLLDRLKDFSQIYAAWVDYAAARQCRGDLLLKLAKNLSSVLTDAKSAKSSRGTTFLFDHELYFKPSVPVCPIMSYAWMPTGAD